MATRKARERARAREGGQREASECMSLYICARANLNAIRRLWLSAIARSVHRQGGEPVLELDLGASAGITLQELVLLWGQRSAVESLKDGLVTRGGINWPRFDRVTVTIYDRVQVRDVMHEGGNVCLHGPDAATRRKCACTKNRDINSLE